MNKNKSNPSRKTYKELILKSGLPLEFEIYMNLINCFIKKERKTCSTNWIQSDYPFVTLNEHAERITRTIDFVVSVTFEKEDFMFHNLYFLIECKSVNVNEKIWLFMLDLCPVEDDIFGVFGGQRPNLYQYSEPIEKIAKSSLRRKKKIDRKKQTILQIIRRGILHCAKGITLGQKKETESHIKSGLHQIRDALHFLAIERFRLFLKRFHPFWCISFIPIIVTNAELRILNPKKVSRISNLRDDAKFDVFSYKVDKLLIRVPQNFILDEYKNDLFNKEYIRQSMTDFGKSLPSYKKERTIRFHMTNFFRNTPTYAWIVNKDCFVNLINEEMKWASCIYPSAQVYKTKKLKK